MRENGIETPKQYACDLGFAKWYTFGGYDVIVTIEDFVQNEIKEVNASVARLTGELLAKMHQISEERNLHVDNQVLFDPFEENDLFDFEKFKSIEKDLNDDNKEIFDLIVQKYYEYIKLLDLLKYKNKYAVQGDISNCNLYMSEDDKLGVFDFNRSGDSVLFCDVIMQAVFESRLMDYPENSLDINFEKEILEAFLEGYSSIRKFSQEEVSLFPYLYAIITAFWRFDIEFKEDSLINITKSGNQNIINERLNKILKILTI